MPCRLWRDIRLFRHPETRNLPMKLLFRSLIVAAALGLSACQSPVPPHAAVLVEAAHAPNAAAVAQQTARNDKALLAAVTHPEQRISGYFSADGTEADKPVADGFYRMLYGTDAQGDFVVQDFYADGSPQVNVFRIRGREHLKNFDNEGVLGPVVWYAKNGVITQSAYLKEGKFEGDVVEYYPEGGARVVRAFHRGVLSGMARFYYANGRLQAQMSMQSIDKEGRLGGTWRFWYPDGAPQLEVVWGNATTPQSLRGWNQAHEALSAVQAAALLQKNLQLLEPDLVH